MKYRPDIDGLRALAVIPVLCFHAKLSFTGGFVGVDIFFVISGYLITGLILKEINEKKFSIVTFWERRIRRIFPPLAIVVATTLIAAWFLFLPADFYKVGQSVFAQALLISNVFFWRGTGYFQPGDDARPLLHTWSLAVEEQFYVLFPFILIALTRWSRKPLIPLIVAGALISFALSVSGSYHHPSATFFLLPTRAWELLLGAFLASLVNPRLPRPWIRECFAALGLLAIFYAVFFYNNDTRFPGAAALLPCLGTALIIWSGAERLTLIGKFLALRPVVFIGLISYSLYLWHWPILVFANYWGATDQPAYINLLLLAASFPLAILSWKFVEAPFRKKIWFKKRAAIFSFAALCNLSLIVGGFLVFHFQGFPSRFPPLANQYADAVNDRRNVDQTGLADALAGRFIPLGVRDNSAPLVLMLWGDSHAMVYVPLLDALCAQHHVRGLAAAYTGTVPLVGFRSPSLFSLRDDSLPFSNAVIQYVRTHHVPNVLIAARWSAYDDGSLNIQRGFQQTIDALKNSGAHLWILKDVPGYTRKIPKALAGIATFGGSPRDLEMTTLQHFTADRCVDAVIDACASTSTSILDPAPLLLDPATGRYLVEKAGISLYYDENHLSLHGAPLVAPIFDPLFPPPAAANR